MIYTLDEFDVLIDRLAQHVHAKEWSKCIPLCKELLTSIIIKLR